MKPFLGNRCSHDRSKTYVWGCGKLGLYKEMLLGQSNWAKLEPLRTCSSIYRGLQGVHKFVRRGSFSGTQHKSRTQLWAAVPFAPNSAILRTFCVGTRQITIKPPSVWFCTVSPLLFCCQERCLVIPIWNVRFQQQTLLMLMLRGAISLHRGLYDDTNLDQGPNLWRRVQHHPNDSGPLPRLWPLFRYGWGGRCKILNWMCWFEMDLLSLKMRSAQEVLTWHF